jgi:type IV secretion system protein VirB5
MRGLRSVVVAGLVLLCTAWAPGARAGVPVIDGANLVQSVQQVIQQIQQVEQQIAQLQQLQQQFASMNGIRGLANMANNPLLQNYIPRDAAQVLRGISTGGYQGLSGAARAAREAGGMLYNCENVSDTRDRAQCEASLSAPYQQRQFVEDALGNAGQRMQQISQLLGAAAGAADPKAISEIQARIAGEQAMLTHELTQIQLVAQWAQAQQDVERARAAEWAAAQAAKTGRPGEALR